MELQHKEALVVRFLELFEQYEYEFNEKGKEDWNTANIDEQIEIITEFAFHHKFIWVAKILLEFAQNQNERMSLQPLFESTNNYYEISYSIDKDNTKFDIEDLIIEVVSYGGQFVGEPSYLKNNTLIYISVGFENPMLAWKFHREFRNGKFYSCTREYHKEIDEKMIKKAINEGTFVWDYYNLHDLLHNSGFSISRGIYNDWLNLAALLQTGFVDISVEECPIPEMPERKIGDPINESYFSALSVRGTAERGFLAYCSWYWLNQRGDEEISFPSSLCNVSSERLKTYVKVGDAEPSQIISFFLSQDKTYVHMPCFTTPTLIIFKPNEKYLAYKNGDKGSRSRVSEEFEKVIELEEERKVQREKKLQLRNYNLSQLKKHDENAIFTTGQVGKILTNDETSPFKGQKVSTEKIRKWILSGELNGFKNDNKWMVKKEDLMDFTNRKSK
ncbi:helix-turn-helix domain-containing protein [Halalkalibacter kiskunsagensis]|uniref:Helix-turn-helix domain-containing protein n=1 Tax=Halalkalibacter kiskunsagensis TaxID=1548599 RepID=A0ABV6KHN7_9BACI